MAINLKFFGDFYIDSSQTTESISDRLYPVLQTINDEDLIILNLESPLGKSESPRSDKSSLLSIDDGEIDFKNLFKKVLVNLGNNHITDYGIEGIDKTIKKLESNKIPFVGVGHNLEAASRPFIYSDDDLNIGFFSSTSSNPEVSSIIAGEGYGCVSYDTNFDLISKQLLEYDDLDYKVMLVHWGHEYSYIQSLDQRKFGRKFIDLGFDLVIGTHPHIIQGVESYKNGTIVYSLGNFIFDSFRKKKYIS